MTFKIALKFTSLDRSLRWLQYLININMLPTISIVAVLVDMDYNSIITSLKLDMTKRPHKHDLRSDLVRNR